MKNKRYYFEITLEIIANEGKIYWGTGKISICKDKLEGYIGYDYLKGYYKNDMIYMELYKYDFELGISHKRYRLITSDFELPGRFSLLAVEEEGEIATITFVKKAEGKMDLIQDNILNAKQKCGI